MSILTKGHRASMREILDTKSASDDDVFISIWALSEILDTIDALEANLANLESRTECLKKELTVERIKNRMAADGIRSLSDVIVSMAPYISPWEDGTPAWVVVKNGVSELIDQVRERRLDLDCIDDVLEVGEGDCRLEAAEKLKEAGNV